MAWSTCLLELYRKLSWNATCHVITATIATKMDVNTGRSFLHQVKVLTHPVCSTSGVYVDTIHCYFRKSLNVIIWILFYSQIGIVWICNNEVGGLLNIVCWWMLRDTYILRDMIHDMTWWRHSRNPPLNCLQNGWHMPCVCPKTIIFVMTNSNTVS